MSVPEALTIPNPDSAGTGSPKRRATNPGQDEGSLQATILSLYDLPSREQPIGVSITCCGITVTSGPPSSRHKDRNSFKFSTGGSKLLVSAPLKELYHSTVTIRVLYANRPRLNLKTEYELNELKIGDQTWLILNFEETHKSELSERSDNEGESKSYVAPTLRLKLQLKGPYRPEIAALITCCQAWFGVMDSIEDSTKQTLSKIPKLPALPRIPLPLLLAPGVAAVTAGVVISPIVIGFFVVTLPFTVPLVVAGGVVLAIVLTILMTLYLSTSSGRSRLNEFCDPLIHTVYSSNVAVQTLVYDTGPRPSPVSLARAVLPNTIWTKLFTSLGIDLIGSSSYLLPFVGEVFDLAWAPMQTILIMAMYDPVFPGIKFVSFVEEILPFTDVVPSATIGWVAEFGPQVISDAFGGNKPNPNDPNSYLDNTDVVQFSNNGGGLSPEVAGRKED